MTIVLLSVAHLAVGYVTLGVTAAWFLSLVSCLDGCDLPGVTDAASVAMSAPAAVLWATIAGSVGLLLSRRIAFWVPLIGGGAAFALAAWGWANFLAVA